MAKLGVLRKKKRKRVAGRKRQYGLFLETGKRGHLKQFRKHRRAVRYLNRLITRAVAKRKFEREFASKNFRYSEFNTKDGTPVPSMAYKGLDDLCQTFLEPLRARFGAVYITSGHRHAAYNRAIGGASMSVHIYDYPGRDGSAVAADVVCRTGTPQQWGDFLAGLGADGIGVYSGSGFTHVDNRGRMGWSDSRWWG